jgi:hypothetical protein
VAETRETQRRVRARFGSETSSQVSDCLPTRTVKTENGFGSLLERVASFRHVEFTNWLTKAALAHRGEMELDHITLKSGERVQV